MTEIRIIKLKSLLLLLIFLSYACSQNIAAVFTENYAYNARVRVSAELPDNYAFKMNWTTPTLPYFIDVDNNGNVYIASRSGDSFYKYNPNGDLLGSWGGYGTDDGEFNDPEGIAVDSIRARWPVPKLVLNGNNGYYLIWGQI